MRTDQHDTRSRVSDETDYYAAVEKHFVALRGSPLFVSPGEWQLIHRWREAQIPLRVVKQGLDRAFANSRSRRPIRRLSYCRQSVEATYRRFREAVAGVGRPNREMDGPSNEANQGLSDVRDYLRRTAKELTAVGQKIVDTHSPLSEAIARATKRLDEIHGGIKEPVRLDELERELEDLEAALLSAAESALDAEGRDACRDLAEKSLRDYRTRMPADVFESALRSAYRKRVRSRFDLPALSIFYL